MGIRMGESWYKDGPSFLFPSQINASYLLDMFRRVQASSDESRQIRIQSRASVCNEIGVETFNI